MGCATGKTTVPNKNKLLDQKSTAKDNPNLLNNNNNLNSNQPIPNSVNQSLTTSIQGPEQYTNPQSRGYLSNQGLNQSLQISNQPVDQSGLKGTNTNNLSNFQGQAYNSQYQLNNFQTQLYNSENPQNSKIIPKSQIIQSSQAQKPNPQFVNSNLANSQANDFINSSSLKPNQQILSTMDDQIVNEQKQVSFDLGIKFSIQIEVD